MKKLISFLAVFLFPAIVFAQPWVAGDIPLDMKQWYSMSAEATVPRTWTDANEYVVNTGFQLPAPGATMCIAQADANCSLFTVPGAGGIWEVRVRDGNGATLADVEAMAAANIAVGAHAMYTLTGVYGYSTAGGAWAFANVLEAQADNVVNTENGVVTSSFLYGFDGATWDRLDAFAHADNIANTANGVNTSAFLYGYDGATWDRLDVLAAGDAIAAAQPGLVTTSLTHFYELTAAVQRRWGGDPMNADNVVDDTVVPYVASFGHAYDGAAWDRLRAGATFELQVTDIATRPGEDAGNGWRDVNKEEVAAVTPAVQDTNGVNVLTTVLTAREIIHDPGWCVSVLNDGAGALTALNIEVSPDNTNWDALPLAPAAQFAGVRNNNCAANLGAGADCSYCVGFSAYRYLRVQANSGGTDVQVWYTANKQ